MNDDLNKKLLNFYFLPIDFIKYTSTSDIRYLITIFSLNKAEENHIKLNVREVVNFYIAEGFYKFQTNYMNSKVKFYTPNSLILCFPFQISYGDLKNMCHYLVYKLKYGNFMDMCDK